MPSPPERVKSLRFTPALRSWRAAMCFPLPPSTFPACRRRFVWMHQLHNTIIAVNIIVLWLPRLFLYIYIHDEKKFIHKVKKNWLIKCFFGHLRSVWWLGIFSLVSRLRFWTGKTSPPPKHLNFCGYGRGTGAYLQITILPFQAYVIEASCS